MRKTPADSLADNPLIPKADTVPPLAGHGRPGDALLVSQLRPLLESYLLDGQYQLKSTRYLADQRKLVVNRLLPFLEGVAATHCGRSELRQFLIHTRAGGNHGGGSKCSEATVANYFRSLRAFWSWIVLEEILKTSPFEGMPAPKVPKQLIQPFNVWRLYRDRWAVEHLPLVAKPILGCGQAFVFGQESRLRLPELALICGIVRSAPVPCGSVLSSVAATCTAVATGFWDRACRATCGRLRRVLNRVRFWELPVLGEQLRKKASVTCHLVTGVEGHRRQKACQAGRATLQGA